MSGTILLYDVDPYQVQFTAKVEGCIPEGPDRYAVILDQTQFFPEQGGQTPDRGTLDGQKVRDVQMMDGAVLHYVTQPIARGKEVKGQVDWGHRFSNMQQHTGEHIFSGLVHARYGYENVGFHLSDNSVTMDYNGPLTQKQVDELESLANAKIWQGIPVVATYPDAASLAQLTYRSKKEIDGPIRIVSIEGVDVCACCAPHVKDTAQVGILKVMNVQSYKGGVRLNILCGRRALEAFQVAAKVQAELVAALKVPPAELATSLTIIQGERDAFRQNFNYAQRKLLKIELDALPADAKTKLLFSAALTPDIQRDGVNYLMSKSDGYCGIFCGSDITGYSFIIGSKSLDCNPLAQALRQAYDAKCGGSAKMIQGSVAATEVALRGWLGSV